MSEDEVLEYLGLTPKKMEQMRTQVAIYESIEKVLNESLFGLEDKDLIATIELLKTNLYDNEEYEYKKNKDKIEEVESFDIYDYVSNDGIYESVLEERRSGF